MQQTIQQQTIKRLFLALLCLLLTAAGTDVAASDDATPLTPKGIYHDVDRYQRTGIKFHVQLKYGAELRRVPVSYPFVSGDRFTFTFEINRDTYISVINCTLRDDEDEKSIRFEAKRIDRVRDAPPPSPPPITVPPITVPARSSSGPRLLFPTYEAGINNRLQGDVPYGVPNRGHYVMDQETGTERLFVVISDRFVELDLYFDPATGQVKSAAAARRLEQRIREWKKNADVELLPKGVVHEVAGYGVAVDPAKPAVVEIDLEHGS